MEFVYSKEEWTAPLLEQERLLRFSSFDRKDAGMLGKRMMEEAYGRYSGVALRIVMDGLTVFSHMMEGSSLENEWWMDKKYRTALKTGRAGMLSLLLAVSGELSREDWWEDEGSYALCGGCIPIKLCDGSIAGYALASGLPHECDHQVIADAMAALLNVKIPSIAK